MKAPAAENIDVFNRRYQLFDHFHIHVSDGIFYDQLHSALRAMLAKKIEFLNFIQINSENFCACLMTCLKLRIPLIEIFLIGWSYVPVNWQCYFPSWVLLRSISCFNLLAVLILLLQHVFLHERHMLSEITHCTTSLRKTESSRGFCEDVKWHKILVSCVRNLICVYPFRFARFITWTFGFASFVVLLSDFLNFIKYCIRSIQYMWYLKIKNLNTADFNTCFRKTKQICWLLKIF